MKRPNIAECCLLFFFTAILAVAGGCGISPAEGDEAALSCYDRAVAATRLKPRVDSPDTAPKLDTSLLREIEQRVLPSPFVDGPNRHAELPDYYWAENRPLRDRLEDAKETFRREPTSNYRALTLVAGAAGVGKTFIKGKVSDKGFSKTAVCKFDIGELYDEWAEGGVVEDKADLATDDLVISRLKSVSDKSQPRLREYLEAQNANFFVIDSLDEIHPDDYAWALEQVADFVNHGDRQFVHVAVFGRGFAFRGFWLKNRECLGDANVELHLLNSPAFRTTGDLAVSSWNYHSWKYQLSWAPDGREGSKMPLDAYANWVESGFCRNGMFQSVTCAENDSMCPEVHDAFVQCASERPLVRSALHNLAGNGMIREILQQEALERRQYDERRIARAYLEEWLIRETKVHDRPSVERRAHLDLYLSLLGRVALKHLQDGAIDDIGYFTVRDGDSVTTAHEGQERVFSVKRILNGSGLVITDPRDEGPAKYRFEPLWTHRLLAEMHCEQVAKEGRLALCPCAE